MVYTVRPRRDLQEAVKADAVLISYVDPSFGISSYGIGAVLQFLSIGADIIAFGTAAMALAPRIRKACTYLRRKFKTVGGVAPIHFSSEALQVLTVAEICISEGIDPAKISRVDVITHNCAPYDPGVERQMMNCAYTITTSAELEDGFLHVWNYLVTSHENRIFLAQKR